MDESIEIPVIVTKISIEGIKNTNDDFIKKQIQSKEVFSAKTMEELSREIQSVKERLGELDIFNSIDAVLDSPLDSEKRDLTKANLHVIFKVDEKKPRKFDIKAMCGLDNSVGLNLEMIEQNLFGRAVKIDANYHNNIRQVGGRSLTLIKPLEGIPRIKMSCGIWDNNYDHWWSKFTESSTGGFGEVSMNGELGRHQFRLEAMARQLVANDKAPVEICKENGHNMKASLKHIFTRDTRDDKVYPEAGYRVSLLQEMFTDMTRIGGDNIYLENLNLKLEAEFQKSFPVRQFVIENTLSGGLITSVTKDDTVVPISDRYFVGGPLSMRGYDLRSMGPLTGDGVPLGTNTYIQHGLHLYSPLPYLAKDGYASLFRLHAFMTTATTADPWDPSQGNRPPRPSGDVDTQTQHTPAHRLLHNYVSSFRCTTGLGVVFKLANTFRVEVNYCVPVRVHPGDRASPGFQFGIGVLYT